MRNFVQVENVKKYYQSSKALDGVSLSLEEGKQYVLQGASGSGKSTLLYLLGGLDIPDSGKLIIDGKDLSHFRDEDLSYYRNQTVGFVFQFHFLLSSMNCLENILLPSHIGGLFSRKLERKVLEQASLLGISDCLRKFPHQLSGGEQQRVNILRAVSLSPKLLLCDEPTGNLDSLNSEKVLDLIKSVASSLAATLLLVTHDDHIAKTFSQRLFLKDGKLLSER